MKKYILLAAISINTLFYSILVFSRPFYINDKTELIFCHFLFLALYIIFLSEFKFSKTIISPIIFITTSLNLIFIDFFLSNTKNVKAKKNLPLIAKKQNKYFDERKIFEYTKDRNISQDQKYYPNTSINKLLKSAKYNTAIFPLSNISDSNIVYCNESGKRIEYRSNHYGFRSNRKKINFKSKIFLIGDSFTQGGCVTDENTFESILEKRFSNYEVNAFGRGGTSLLYQYAIFKEYIFDEIHDNDHLVIFHFPRNDFLEITSEYKNNFLNKYISKKSFSQGLKNKEINNIKDEILKNYIAANFKDRNYEYSILKNIKLENIIRFSFTIFEELSIPKKNLGMELYAKTLNKISDDLANKNSNISLVCIPTFKDFRKQYDKTTCSISSEYLKNKVRKINIIIPEKEFLNQNTENLYPFNNQFTHFSDEGYKLFSQSFLEKIKIK